MTYFLLYPSVSFLCVSLLYAHSPTSLEAHSSFSVDKTVLKLHKCVCIMCVCDIHLYLSNKTTDGTVTLCLAFSAHVHASWAPGEL